MIETGIRVGDAVRVRGTNISREGGEYWLNMTAQKTGKPIRARLSDSLGARLSRSGRHYCFAGRDNTRPITRQTVWRRLKTAARLTRVELDGTSPHSLRKCFAVELMRREGLHAVQDALQHSNDSVTRVYAYADTVLRFDSDEPIRWRDLDIVCEYLLDRLRDS